jgi:opacity protein-like surface antigen
MQIRNVFSLLIFATAAVFPICGHTQIQMFEPERVGRWYLSGAGGSFKQDTDADIGKYHGQYGLAIGAGYRLRPHLGLEIDGLFASQRFEIDSAVISTDAHANLTGIGGLVKLILPLDRVELYVGGGVGIYSTTFWSDVGFQGVAGLDLFLSRHLSVGVEYRRLKLDAFVGALVPGFDLGGDFVFATVRGHF